MPLLRRITNICSAHLHDAVEQFEVPEVMLRQSLRELESDYRSAQCRAVELLASEKLLRQRCEDASTQVARAEERAQRAVQANDDDAARRALVGKRDAARTRDALERQLEVTARMRTTLQDQLVGMRHRITDVRQRVTLLVARKQMAQTQARLLAAEPAAFMASEFTDMERWLSALELEEARALAWCELRGFNQVDLQDAAFDEDLEAELAQLKQNHPQ